MREVGIDVEGEAVHGDPFRDRDSDRSDLLIPHPYSYVGGISPGHKTEIREKMDDSGFKTVHVGGDSQSQTPKAQDRITDYLPGSVVGDVTAPGALMDCDAGAD